MALVTLRELLDAGVHFGHQSSRWNPKMFPYIYTEQNGIHVIDLVQTARLLTHAYNYVQKSAKEGKQFLFIGTKKTSSGHYSRKCKKNAEQVISATVGWGVHLLIGRPSKIVLNTSKI
jgi:small subunit ribosomal protein S2